jgi:type IV pilus assembly protein PilZ
MLHERREQPRVEVELEVHYRTVQEFAAAYIHKISGGGIFIRTQQPLPLNKEVYIRFTLPGIPRTVEVRGLVVWTNPAPSRSGFPSGMGIKFLDLDPEVAKLIAQFVKAKGQAPASQQKS